MQVAGQRAKGQLESESESQEGIEPTTSITVSLSLSGIFHTANEDEIF